MEKPYKEITENGRTYYVSETGFKTPHLKNMLRHIEKRQKKKELEKVDEAPVDFVFPLPVNPTIIPEPIFEDELEDENNEELE